MRHFNFNGYYSTVKVRIRHLMLLVHYNISPKSTVQLKKSTLQIGLYIR